MRYTRFLDHDNLLRLGLDRGDGRCDPIPPGLDDLPDALYHVHQGPEPVLVEQQVLPIAHRLAPVEPPAIFGIGLNYREHALETGAAIPERPVVFMKNPAAVTAHGMPIRIPKVSTQPEVDYEGELAVIIGEPAFDVSEADALNHVLGYTIANDVSARWWQKKGCQGQFVRGKSFDTFCPLGPVVVTADEIPDPQALTITTTLNGQIMQQGSTSDMVFTVAQLIAFLSQDTTLLPGTVILTGTPPGVGVARDPQVFLQPGDEVRVSISGIGALDNSVA